MEEIWKPVVIKRGGVVHDYTGLYQVSNTGKVRALNYNGTSRILKQYKNNRGGYLQVGLAKDGKTKMFLVHRLVATMFIPNDDPTVKTIVHHIDHNVQNNHVDNLQWTTNQYNVEEGRGKRVRCVETGEEWDSVQQASLETGFNYMGIYYCCIGKQKTTRNFHFEYVE